MGMIPCADEVDEMERNKETEKELEEFIKSPEGKKLMKQFLLAFAKWLDERTGDKKYAK